MFSNINALMIIVFACLANIQFSIDIATIYTLLFSLCAPCRPKCLHDAHYSLYIFYSSISPRKHSVSRTTSIMYVPERELGS